MQLGRREPVLGLLREIVNHEGIDKDVNMDAKTGDIYDEETVEQQKKRILQAMNIPPTLLQLARKPIDPQAVGRVGRNDPCPCGSGKKFKRCCQNK